MLLHPNFVNMVNASKESGEAIRLFFIPIILSVWFMSLVKPIADKISPKAISSSPSL